MTRLPPLIAMTYPIQLLGHLLTNVNISDGKDFLEERKTELAFLTMTGATFDRALLTVANCPRTLASCNDTGRADKAVFSKAILLILATPTSPESLR